MSTADTGPGSAVAPDPNASSTQRRFTFSVGSGPRLMAAVDILQEIPLGASLQRLPNAPPVLAGAVNLRGAIRLVFDPLAWLGVSPRPAQRRILLLDRDASCAGTLIVGEPRLDELRAAPGTAATGPFAALTRSVWSAGSDTVLEIDHRAWFAQMRDHSQPA